MTDTAACRCRGHLHDGDQQTLGACVICGCPTDAMPGSAATWSGEPFWNLTDGVRPAEPTPGLFAQVCEDIGHHVYDNVYGPLECARCGDRDKPVKKRWWQR